MSWRRTILSPALLFLACANPASADSDPNARAVANASAKGLDQIVYKGLVGNALDGIPMDPAKRVSLQRTNAILSNTWSGHTLTTLAGLSNPVLLIGGLVWGVWSAANIKPEEDGAQAASAPSQIGAEFSLQQIALLESSASAAPARLHSETAAAKPIAAVPPDEPLRPRSPVVKVWLPQRSPAGSSVQ